MGRESEGRALGACPLSSEVLPEAEVRFQRGRVDRHSLPSGARPQHAGRLLILEEPCAGYSSEVESAKWISVDERDRLEEPLLDAAEAARLLNVPRSTLYELVRSRGLPHVRIGKRGLRFTREGLQEWVRHNTHGARGSA